MISINRIPEKTLKRIEEDIRKNDLGKARDRLHGLLSTYPNELEIRKKLGDIYDELKQPSMAGRYWYLEKNKTPHMEKACAEFEKSMGNDPYMIARTLKYKGDIELLKRSDMAYIPKEVKERLLNDKEDTIEGTLFTIGCISILLVLIIFEGIGVYSFFKWVL